MKNAKFDSVKNGLRLEELRNLAGLSQKRLAQEVKISATNIWRWENGLNLPSVPDCWTLADYFGVTVDYLIGRKEEE